MYGEESFCQQFINIRLNSGNLSLEQVKRRSCLKNWRRLSWSKKEGSLNRRRKIVNSSWNVFDEKQGMEKFHLMLI